MRPALIACAVAALLLAGAPPAAGQVVGRTIRPLKQDDPRAFDPATTDGKTNCAATAAVMCLEWWSRNGYPGLMPANPTDNILYAAVRSVAQMGKADMSGMDPDKMKAGIDGWISTHGGGLTTTVHQKAPIRDAVFDQFEHGGPGPGHVGQDVIWLGANSDMTEQDKEPPKLHAMTMASMDRNNPVPIKGDANAGRRVEMCDPATGKQEKFNMAEDGSLYSATGNKKLFNPRGFITVCPSV